MRCASGLSSILLLILMIGTENACAQNPVAAESALKAAYIYHFIQFTEWPDGFLKQREAIDVCVPATSALRADLTALSGQLAHGKPIRVRTYDQEAPVDCIVLILSGAGRMENTPAPSQNVLTVREEAERSAGDDAIIALSVDGRRVSFSINQQLATAAKLSLSSKLLRLARSVK
jgi:hypothetical protein